jgi:hypothetical protein
LAADDMQSPPLLALGEAEPLEPPSAACRHFRLEDLHLGEALRDGLGRSLAGRE